MSSERVLQEAQPVDDGGQEIDRVAALLAETEPDADLGARQMKAAVLIARAKITGIELDPKSAEAVAYLAEISAARYTPAPVAVPVAPAPAPTIAPTIAPAPDRRIIRAKAEAEALTLAIETLVAKRDQLQKAIASAPSR